MIIFQRCIRTTQSEIQHTITFENIYFVKSLTSLLYIQVSVIDIWIDHCLQRPQISQFL